MKNLHEAQKVLKTAQESAACLRNEFLEELAQLYITNKNTKAASIIKNIRHREEVRSSFASLRYATKGKQAGSVSTVKVPLPTNPIQAMYDKTVKCLKFEHTWKEIDDSDEIMEKLLSKIKLHLHQAYETLFASGPLKDYIGKFGLGVGAQEILKGHFDPNKSKNMPAVSYWLKHHVRRAVPPASVQTNLTVEEFKAAVTKQTEMTSSSPSSRHYGHYKAILTNESICIVHTIMMTLPFRIGFTPC
jgi:hypothetical protein